VFVLDTDIVSNLVKQRPSNLLIGRLAAVPADEQYTSSITLGEILYGILRARSGSEALRQRIDRLLSSVMTILPFDANAARYYGQIRADLESRGQSIGDADTRIAAIAMSRGFVVVTGNVRHFVRVPDLRVENWLA
jgi:predicted nucleic acid-binding protein